MKFVTIVSAAVAFGDVVSECESRIQASQDGWNVTCQYWCGQYAPVKCEGVTDAGELISCIQKEVTYCYDPLAAVGDDEVALTDEELVAGCEEKMSSTKYEWIATCKNFCKSFLPGQRGKCSKEAKDVDTLVGCVHEQFDYCISKDVESGDIIELCEQQIHTTKQEWLPTCKRWCSQYAPGTELGAACDGSIEKTYDLIHCINKYQPYCF